jgi:hypothetical protein
MAQEVECLSSKHEALSSDPSTTKNKQLLPCMVSDPEQLQLLKLHH